MLNGNKSKIVCKLDLVVGKTSYYLLVEDWFSSTQYLVIWYCIWYLSFSCQKESCVNWIISDQDSFGKEIVKRKNIDWLAGMLYADQKTRVDWVLLIFRSRTRLYLVSGFLSYLPRTGFGKQFSGGNILAQKRCPRYIGNRGTRTFGRGSWRQRSTSFALVLSI